MNHTLLPVFRLTHHARQRMAHRNLSPELLEVIQTHGTAVTDGFVMLHGDIAGAIRPLQERIRRFRRIAANYCKKRGTHPVLAFQIQEIQQEIAAARRQLEAIRKTEGFLVCVVDGYWVKTIQRAYPKKLRRALRGPARAHPFRRRQRQDSHADPEGRHSPRCPDRMKARRRTRHRRVSP